MNQRNAMNSGGFFDPDPAEGIFPQSSVGYQQDKIDVAG
jgi:hypothetical protein